MSDPQNIVTVLDDDGNVLSFEELDRIEIDNGNRYIAMIPSEDNDEYDPEENELIILRVRDNENGTVLESIDDEDEFMEIAEIFQERLSESYDFEE